MKRKVVPVHDRRFSFLEKAERINAATLKIIHCFWTKMNLFGKAKKQEYAPKANPLETIKVLREQLDTLEKRENHMSKKVDMALAEAKQKAGQKDKKAALFALKRKKMYEAEVTKLQGARITMDSQINALESATVNIETFKAMQSGASALRNIRGNIDADKVSCTIYSF